MPGVLDDGTGMFDGLATPSGGLDGEDDSTLCAGDFGPSCGSRPEIHLI